MKYYVTFQEFGPNGRPIDHPSASDFETDGLGMIPNVGDYVQLVAMSKPDAPQYSGRVKSRLFRYFNDETCGINIVVEDNKNDDWGAVIKE
ncbi:hypothetical protein F9K81_00180 [Brucella anthropi]|uniref:hypothetical protein n=1 Tax=Brucella anthropi TaxID=529 RepID=UPI00124C640B|nr:hypothetical protein [Brucella anthropi]KAB2759916.1 hypothetical protein F9K81_00180 [Brucella anthropi]